FQASRLAVCPTCECNNQTRKEEQANNETRSAFDVEAHMFRYKAICRNSCAFVWFRGSFSISKKVDPRNYTKGHEKKHKNAGANCQNSTLTLTKEKPNFRRTGASAVCQSRIEK